MNAAPCALCLRKLGDLLGRYDESGDAAMWQHYEWQRERCRQCFEGRCPELTGLELHPLDTDRFPPGVGQ
jgi:hypothetical protein